MNVNGENEIEIEEWKPELSLFSCNPNKKENSEESSIDLRSEVLEIHLIKIEKNETWKQKCYICKICKKCQKTMTTKYTLKLHMKNVHEGIKDYQCEICGK